MSHEFQIGDRVVCNCAPDYLFGKIGTVVDIYNDVRGSCCQVGVQFDEYCHGHDCRGKSKYGYGWYLPTICVSNCQSRDDIDITYEIDGNDLIELILNDDVKDK